MSFFKKICSPIRALSLALLTVGAAGSANAGYYTNFESQLDSIFGQATFGASPIDIRFDSVLTITSSDLAVIDSAAEFKALGAMGVASPAVSAFFVDSLNFCGIALTGIDGCAGVPGNFLIVASVVDGSVFGHELGHNFGLSHDETFGNLMRAQSGDTDLSLLPSQVQKILGSTLVQTDALGQKFVQIQPYVVVASVPEPSAYILMSLGLGFLAFVRHRKSSKA